VSNILSRQLAGEGGINVSIIIAAYNATETVVETLCSLRAQNHTGWQAIVVDDGSSDTTTACVQGLAACDPRIRLVTQERTGVSAARNKGLAVADGDWLLFLDADDWLAPLHLERMTQVASARADVDAVHCGWTRVAPDGTRMAATYGPEAEDLFPVFARRCAFSVHACIVRRSIVEDVGGFDTSLHTCEDWDLWQRIARAGARFAALREALALYRMRPRSASNDGLRLLADGLRVITQGHSPDPRVHSPVPAYAAGLTSAQLPSVRLDFASWPAGLVLGSGDDARPLLPLLGDDHDPGLDPFRVAESLFESALLPTCRTPDAWWELWPRLQPRIDDFLLALEGQSMAPRLAHRAHAILERKVLAHTRKALPVTVGTTHGVRVELTEPIPDIKLPPAVERLQCLVELGGRPLGTLEQPGCDGIVLSYVLTDAIAATFCWPILGQFFEHTLYPSLTVEADTGGLTLRRGDCRLARGLANDAPFSRREMHDRIGWAVFLQEVWGCPERPVGWFYQGDRTAQPRARSWQRVLQRAWTRLGRCHRGPAAPETTPRGSVDGGWLAIEVSDELPAVIEVNGVGLDILLTVGGVALGVIPVPAHDNLICAAELRAKLTEGSGVELCRAAVREAILGRSLTAEPTSLRARLAAAAVAQRSGDGMAAGSPTVDSPTRDERHPLGRAIPSGARTVVLGRRVSGDIGTSASRRAMLPAAAADECVMAASLAGEPVVCIPETNAPPDYVLYLPEMISPRLSPSPAATARIAPVTTSPRVGVEAYGRAHFESLFATKRDPWHYANPYEQTKYAQTLALLPEHPIDRALELACAEGHFTLQLAPRVGSLVAADISQIALSRAAERCAARRNVCFQHLDLMNAPLPGRFDLIVCSEVLYYCTDKDSLRSTARKLADALEPGGYLLTAHANLVVDDPHHTGFDWDCPFGARVIGEMLRHTHPLQLVKELRTPLYRIQLFQHDTRASVSLMRRTPDIIEGTCANRLPPEVASHVLWQGGHAQARNGPWSILTGRLPILMYHRVAPTGSAAMTRYRLSPEAFEHQLRYLRDAGYYSASLEDWRLAMQTKTPLPGRAVLITFDDGYLDFQTYAWPLLQRYGFSATVFLVTGAIDESNSWDQAYGEKVPLLGERELLQLRDEGVTFGSHTVSHRPLTGLPPADVVREGLSSRLILERRLGLPIHAFAYPYGDTDQVVQHLIGACGYLFGLSCRHGFSSFDDSLLALPRIEVSGLDRFQDFVAKLCPERTSIVQSEQAVVRG
jgi:peptidoglycan/xylan/chitin deacetylase (PgdA/CDA1 family)/2-polyprenyl-3-methyl-5-hydroxy-6-metoxy-1,4-benzoquinol methylase